MINDLWYKNAVIYCLSVGTYMDSNGDGIGDFKGLVRRLDYLHGLGVTAIWLMPFQVSPQRDDGYDVSDYYSVDPRYGTLGDFVEFTHGAKQRGIRVLIDLVVNHTSDEHPWFKEARKDPDSKYRDWYVWSKKKPPRPDWLGDAPGSQTEDRAAARSPRRARRAQYSNRLLMRRTVRYREHEAQRTRWQIRRSSFQQCYAWQENNYPRAGTMERIFGSLTQKARIHLI